MIMTKYICKYCNSEFTTKAGLSRHQHHTKYCLELQGITPDKKGITCICGNIYTHKDSLRRHKKGCTYKSPTPSPEPTTRNDALVVKIMEQYQTMIKDLQKQNGDLQKHVTEIASRPTKVINNNNNVLNNLQPITDENLQENLDNLKLDFILDGAKGYANYAKCYPLRDNIICTDKSRKKLKYKDEHGEITNDARLLTKRFFQAISTRNKDILNTAYKDTHEEVKDIVARGAAGDSDITGLLTRATDLQNMLIRSQKAASGEDEEFTQEFINHLVKII